MGRPDPESRPGSIEQIEMRDPALGGAEDAPRLPPGALQARAGYPLLVVHDGSDYLRYSSLRNVLDNLITRLEVAPLIVALTDPGQRLKEYAANPRHARHITEEVLPLLADHYPGGGARGRRLMGASLGAVASLSTAWMHPGTWGRLLLQSGSFASPTSDRHVARPRVRAGGDVDESVPGRPGEPADRVYVSSGVYGVADIREPVACADAQRAGMQVLFTESRDGHNWENGATG